MKKVIVSNLSQLLRLVSENPALLTVPAFYPLRPLYERLRDALKGGSCGCNFNEVIASHKQLFSVVMDNVQVIDNSMIKSILNVHQLCYYTESGDGKRVLRCY
ncbi:MAG: hypothetical protein EBU46_00390 [Nitrosomonadaceae bacterium]|nr:hypothetical protein [Nitrosomonadaceae bacterium]